MAHDVGGATAPAHRITAYDGGVARCLFEAESTCEARPNRFGFRVGEFAAQWVAADNRSTQGGNFSGSANHGEKHSECARNKNNLPPAILTD
ncbi:hypothetical protein ColKHC_10811 [Colletotrichum higginsianum]|nr:hypothetical protein ColKHC_10811 [Colletotrichum higginsianum]